MKSMVMILGFLAAASARAVEDTVTVENQPLTYLQSSSLPYRSYVYTQPAFYSQPSLFPSPGLYPQPALYPTNNFYSHPAFYSQLPQFSQPQITAYPYNYGYATAPAAYRQQKNERYVTDSFNRGTLNKEWGSNTKTLGEKASILA